MVDIPLILSSDGTSLDWCVPLDLASQMDSSNDLQTYVLELLCTDRAAPQFHYGLQPFERRGCWQDTYVGEFGSLFWMGVEANQWGRGSKIGQIKAWAEMALQTVYDEKLILHPAEVDVSWVDGEAVQVQINLTVADNTQRTVTYVVPVT